MQYYIGCSGFYNKDWKEVFYPKGLPQKKWFQYYCSQFNTLEINTTFYRFPKIEFLQKWYDESPEYFKFSVKAPRLITHYKQFKETESLLVDFYAAIQEGLKEKLGPVLFQLPAKISYDESFLQSIIQNVNNRFHNVIEFRNISWWNNEVFEALSKNDISFSGVSLQNLPDDVIANASIIYYRFHGLKKIYFSEYSPEQMQAFANELMSTKKETAYIFFNNTATIAAINNAKQIRLFLGAR